ncbi:hypothetical protein GCM10009841_20320 [Microlunatus panaciterrae]|uniref:Deazaflavin-dependent oxidoreductase (Nitroreductase family) n=1 Tax=Microlunatus panaciterrae TaxID=400768 RepID=A0ABS2RNJ7_9ACTN|nr:nitroreductase family deazaflavin-dependent oxidoreductase [Microlunatus panaciterrae]MBM7800586.1 deazaflavin-dependent oxidoreductase (nitroreductase family) [Microlunatus panaciterrae]
MSRNRRSGGILNRRPRGPLLWAFRLPVVLFRMGAGAVFGRRLIYLVHLGRHTGRRRDTVLEVVDYDPTGPEVFVVSARGPQSDWFLNLQSSGALEVRLGSQHWSRPEHRVLPPDETLRLLQRYRRRHPFLWQALSPLLTAPRHPDADAWTALANRLTAVALRPVSPPAR